MNKLSDLIMAENTEIPLPTIFYCTEIFCAKEKKIEQKNYHVASSYYQTSKMRCVVFHKLLHRKKNEK